MENSTDHSIEEEETSKLALIPPLTVQSTMAGCYSKWWVD